MYAYDADNKLFHSVLTYASKHYCPVVFYKMSGHCYLINDKHVIRSVAENSKKAVTKIISSSLVEERTTTNDVAVQHMESFNVSTAATLPEGVYLVKQSNLDQEATDFISKYRVLPSTKNRKSNIVHLKFQQGLKHEPDWKKRKYVTICIDVTHKESYSYAELNNVAQTNHIKYSNGGIGSVILSILEKSKQSCREGMTEQAKRDFMNVHHHQCAVCELQCDYLEIDHIHPLASGGSNDVSNLQCLCKDCHTKKTVEENESGAYTNIKDNEASIFNQMVLDNVIHTHEFKTWQFVERLPAPYELQNVYKSDMRKCRRNVTYYSRYQFPVYSVMDVPAPFSGKVQCGFYFVETTRTYLFRGNGWYSQPLVEYALEEKLMVHGDIKAELIPSNTLPANHFQKPIDTLLSAFSCEPALQKLSVNSLIGLFGRTKSFASHTKFSLSADDASQWWGDKHNQSEVFIRTYPLDNDVKLYGGIFSEQIQTEATKYPLYKQILEMEAVELHRLEQIIVRAGGKVLDRNTDAIRYSSFRPVPLDEYFWDDEQTVAKYQSEEPKLLLHEVLPSLKRDKPMDMSQFELPWNIQKDYEGTAEEEAQRIVDSNLSWHIDGRAGTGKSFLTNKIMDELKTREIKYMGFSPTNKGARIIGGQTIHIYFKYQKSKNILFEMMADVQYIFIDEVSMMVKDFYQLFLLIKSKFPLIKFIIAGDFGQLPPVKDNWEGDYENSPAMNLLCGGNRIQLMTCRRSDRTLYDVCKKPGNIIRNEFKPTSKTYLNVAYTHKTRRKVNRENMLRYIAEHTCDTIDVKSNPLNPKTQDVKLAKGMPVIAHVTNKKLRFMNSQTFVIDDVTQESLVITNGEDTIKINTKDFHKFFYLGFCLTVHASQGETFSEKYTIHDWYLMCNKAKYVALSRGTSIENIQIA